MYCPRCGRQVADDARFCDQCGLNFQDHRETGAPSPAPSPAPSQMVIEVPSYLPQAILVSILFCLPFGIIALFYAFQVNRRLSRGDGEGAWRASRNARLWCWISFWSGLVLLIASVVSYLVLAARAAGG